MNAIMKLLNVRRKKKKKLCIWRYIQDGFIEIYTPTRVTMAGIGKTIRFPVPRTELYKQSVLYIGSILWIG